MQAQVELLPSFSQREHQIPLPGELHIHRTSLPNHRIRQILLLFRSSEVQLVGGIEHLSKLSYRIATLYSTSFFVQPVLCCLQSCALEEPHHSMYTLRKDLLRIVRYNIRHMECQTGLVLDLYLHFHNLRDFRMNERKESFDYQK